MTTEQADYQCLLHVGYTDTDCEFCESEMDVMNKQYEKLMKENQGLELALQREGAQLDPSSFVALRVDMLTSVLFQDPKQRIHFETEFGKQIKQSLMNATQEVRRAKLLAPGTSVPR